MVRVFPLLLAFVHEVLAAHAVHGRESAALVQKHMVTSEVEAATESELDEDSVEIYNIESVRKRDFFLGDDGNGAVLLTTGTPGDSPLTRFKLTRFKFIDNVYNVESVSRPGYFLDDGYHGKIRLTQVLPADRVWGKFRLVSLKNGNFNIESVKSPGYFLDDGYGHVGLTKKFPGNHVWAQFKLTKVPLAQRAQDAEMLTEVASNKVVSSQQVSFEVPIAPELLASDPEAETSKVALSSMPWVSDPEADTSQAALSSMAKASDLEADTSQTGASQLESAESILEEVTANIYNLESLTNGSQFLDDHGPAANGPIPLVDLSAGLSAFKLISTFHNVFNIESVSNPGFFLDYGVDGSFRFTNLYEDLPAGRILAPFHLFAYGSIKDAMTIVCSPTDRLWAQFKLHRASP